MQVWPAGGKRGGTAEIFVPDIMEIVSGFFVSCKLAGNDMFITNKTAVTDIVKDIGNFAFGLAKAFVYGFCKNPEAEIYYVVYYTSFIINRLLTAHKESIL